MSIDLQITDDEDYNVLIGYCDGDYSSFELERKDHVFSPGGEFPIGYFPLFFFFPLFCILYGAFCVYWMKTLKAEKKKTYYKTILLSAILFIIEYFVSFVFMLYYQFSGNYYSFLLTLFSILLNIIRGVNRSTYLYLTIGYTLFFLLTHIGMNLLRRWTSRHSSGSFAILFLMCF